MENATQELEKEKTTATLGSTARPIREVKARTRKRFSAEDKDPDCFGGLPQRDSCLGALPQGQYRGYPIFS